MLSTDNTINNWVWHHLPTRSHHPETSAGLLRQRVCNTMNAFPLLYWNRQKREADQILTRWYSVVDATRRSRISPCYSTIHGIFSKRKRDYRVVIGVQWRL